MTLNNSSNRENKIIGIKVLGTARTLAMYGIKGRFKIKRTTIPIYIDIITDQKISDWFDIILY